MRKSSDHSLPFAEGRKLYVDCLKGPPDVRAATRRVVRSHSTILDRFLKFATAEGLSDWHEVNGEALLEYVRHLRRRSVAMKVIRKDQTVLKQAVNWLINANHLRGVQLFQLPPEAPGKA